MPAQYHRLYGSYYDLPPRLLIFGIELQFPTEFPHKPLKHQHN
jgi:hypothetical protein